MGLSNSLIAFSVYPILKISWKTSRLEWSRENSNLILTTSHSVWFVFFFVQRCEPPSQTNVSGFTSSDSCKNGFKKVENWQSLIITLKNHEMNFWGYKILFGWYEFWKPNWRMPNYCVYLFDHREKFKTFKKKFLKL